MKLIILVYPEGESAATEDKDKALDPDLDAEAEGEGENDDPLGEHIEMDGEPVVDEDGANGIKVWQHLYKYFNVAERK